MIFKILVFDYSDSVSDLCQKQELCEALPEGGGLCSYGDVSLFKYLRFGILKRCEESSIFSDY